MTASRDPQVFSTITCTRGAVLWNLRQKISLLSRLILYGAETADTEAELQR